MRRLISLILCILSVSLHVCAYTSHNLLSQQDSLVNKLAQIKVIWNGRTALFETMSRDIAYLLPIKGVDLSPTEVTSLWIWDFDNTVGRYDAQRLFNSYTSDLSKSDRRRRQLISELQNNEIPVLFSDTDTINPSLADSIEVYFNDFQLKLYARDYQGAVKCLDNIIHLQNNPHAEPYSNSLKGDYSLDT